MTNSGYKEMTNSGYRESSRLLLYPHSDLLTHLLPFGC